MKNICLTYHLKPGSDVLNVCKYHRSRTNSFETLNSASSGVGSVGSPRLHPMKNSIRFAEMINENTYGEKSFGSVVEPKNEPIDPEYPYHYNSRILTPRIKSLYGQCRNYRTEVEEDERTVIYRTLLFYNSVFLGRYEKKMYLNLLLTFFVVLSSLNPH